MIVLGLVNFTELNNEEDIAFLNYLKRNKKKQVDLKDVDSLRGIGRGTVVGGAFGGLGMYAAKKTVDKLDKYGDKYGNKYSDEELIRKAGERGGKVGATSGAVTGLIYGPGAVFTSPLFAGLGYAGGKFGAKKNARERLKKRKEIERRLREED